MNNDVARTRELQGTAPKSSSKADRAGARPTRQLLKPLEGHITRL